MNSIASLQTQLVEAGLIRKVRANFFEETKSDLLRFGFQEEDVRWVGSADGKFVVSWQEFREIATKLNTGHNNPKSIVSLGGDYVACDLVVVGSEFWLERISDDENWAYWRLCRRPEQQPNTKKIRQLVPQNSRYDSLEDIHKSLQQS